jgi:hypothetical protein
MYPNIPVEDFEEYFELPPLDGASLAQWTQQEYEDERPWKRFKADAGYTKTGEGV